MAVYMAVETTALFTRRFKKNGTLKKLIYDNRFAKLVEDLRVPLTIVDNNTYVVCYNT
jgi:hypothetical protein